MSTRTQIDQALAEVAADPDARRLLHIRTREVLDVAVLDVRDSWCPHDALALQLRHVADWAARDAAALTTSARHAQSPATSRRIAQWATRLRALAARVRLEDDPVAKALVDIEDEVDDVEDER